MPDDLQEAIKVALPNRCCTEGDCPYDTHDAERLADAVRAWLLGQREAVAAAIGSVNQRTGHLYHEGNDACPAAADAVVGVLTGTEAEVRG